MALGGRLLVFLFAISIALSLSGLQGSEDSMTTDFGYSYDANTSELDTTNMTNLSMQGIDTSSGVGGISEGSLNFFDRFEKVNSFVDKVAKFFTGPVSILTDQQAPRSVVYLVGSLWAFLWGIAIVSFIWRKDL